MFQVLATSTTPLDQISPFVIVFPMVTFSWHFLVDFVLYIHVESKTGTRPFHLCSCEPMRTIISCQIQLMNDPDSKIIYHFCTSMTLLVGLFPQLPLPRKRYG